MAIDASMVVFAFSTFYYITDTSLAYCLPLRIYSILIKNPSQEHPFMA